MESVSQLRFTQIRHTRIHSECLSRKTSSSCCPSMRHEQTHHQNHHDYEQRNIISKINVGRERLRQQTGCKYDDLSEQYMNDRFDPCLWLTKWRTRSLGMRDREISTLNPIEVSHRSLVGKIVNEITLRTPCEVYASFALKLHCLWVRTGTHPLLNVSILHCNATERKRECVSYKQSNKHTYN